MFKSPANFLQSCKKSRAWISSREEIQESSFTALRDCWRTMS